VENVNWAENGLQEDTPTPKGDKLKVVARLDLTMTFDGIETINLMGGT
jgi:hypothetical protein